LPLRVKAPRIDRVAQRRGLEGFMGTASRGVSKLVLALAVVSFVGSVAATLMFGTAASAASEPPSAVHVGH
jgi:hypothetical protein